RNGNDRPSAGKESCWRRQRAHGAAKDDWQLNAAQRYGRLWKCRACGKRPRASLPSVAWKSQPKRRPDFPTFPQPLRRAIDQMKKAKTKTFSLPTTAASRHTTPLRGYFLSSRFICEATIHLSSRFYYEATGGWLPQSIRMTTLVTRKTSLTRPSYSE